LRCTCAVFLGPPECGVMPDVKVVPELVPELVPRLTSGAILIRIGPNPQVTETKAQ
jgi:hypothetical protein